MKRKIQIAYLYPDEMNIYGDIGNIIVLKRRLEWRGYEAEVLPVEVGVEFDWREVDLVFGGGGQDSGQLLCGKDLLRHGEELRRLAEDGAPMLLICGLYQLFGRSFVTGEGQTIPGISVFGAQTIAGTKRMIGNVVVASERYGRLVGFENHSGQTSLDVGQAGLGRVQRGYGNRPAGRIEGAVMNEAIGTYLHGPVLPKNPRLADALLLAALRRRWGVEVLEPLDDTLELQAADQASRRP
jgi:CobQ-like glutamine amidotransferase family enzyme